MLTGQHIICLSSIDWDFNWQGHQEIMSAFAKGGNRVLYIENTGVRMPRPHDLPRLKRRLANWVKGFKGFRRIQENLWVYSPVILPFPYSRLARIFNRWLLVSAIRRWMRALNAHDPILWTFLPTGIALDVLMQIEHRLAVYYCIADFEALVPQPHKVRQTEAEIVKRCDVVFAQGKVLEERCRRWNEQVYVFPFGVNLGTFVQAQDAPAETPEDLCGLPRPVIGYIGGIHRHVDMELLQAVAKQRRGWSVVLVGPIQVDAASVNGADNLFLLGEKPFAQLPRYVRAFDVCIIPYRESDYTKTVYPTKLNEYHALGKPVVSTWLPEVAAFNERHGSLVRLARHSTEFIEHIEDALREHDPALIRRRQTVAQEHDWQQRIEQMSRLLEQRLAHKDEAAPGEWQQRLVAGYHRVKQQSLKLAVPLLAYLLLFHSPLLWWVAAPLRVSRSPRPADAIVVFAGGVGESGRAGQGYIERVRKAAQLYQDHYAPALVLSSGYIHGINETKLMQTVATSLGVPASAIVVEDRARNTLENVQFSSAIARAHGWRSLVVVSSPYHMRRALSVFKRQAPEIAVTPVPITDSTFFDRSNGVQLEEWWAILHEYVGLLFYWMKGWV